VPGCSFESPLRRPNGGSHRTVMCTLKPASSTNPKPTRTTASPGGCGRASRPKWDRRRVSATLKAIV